MKHVISVLLENEPGALSRVVGLFSARGYNIETLTVAPTEDATLSRYRHAPDESFDRASDWLYEGMAKAYAHRFTLAASIFEVYAH